MEKKLSKLKNKSKNKQKMITEKMPETERRKRPDTRLPKLRVGGQGPYLRSLEHLGWSSGVKK